MGRVLALDVGDKRIGIAVSDPTRLIASPHSVYTRVGWGPDVRHVHKVAQDTQADSVVVGLPLNMDGSRGFQAEKIEAFAQKLREAELDIHLWDERLSTVSAERALIEGNMQRADRRNTVDQVAAAIILQSYLDANK